MFAVGLVGSFHNSQGTSARRSTTLQSLCSFCPLLCQRGVHWEQKSKGFTHGFIVTFKDTKGREIYLPHPAHQDFVRLVGPHLADVLVFDFFAH